MLFLYLGDAIHSKVGLGGWVEVEKHSFHSFAKAPSGVFCSSVLLFRCHDCLEIRKHPKYFDLHFLTQRLSSMRLTTDNCGFFFKITLPLSLNHR